MTEKKFWAKVCKDGPLLIASRCWMWCGGRTLKGYGQFEVDGTMVGAHRFAWELTNGTIPTSLYVLHKCDNPSCVRPPHLFLGTAKTNRQDMITKGRGNWPKGEDHPMAVLTADIVREIRARYIRGVISQQTLADEFNTTQARISAIVLGQSWRHLGF